MIDHGRMEECKSHIRAVIGYLVSLQQYPAKPFVPDEMFARDHVKKKIRNLFQAIQQSEKNEKMNKTVPSRSAPVKGCERLKETSVRGKPSIAQGVKTHHSDSIIHLERRLWNTLRPRGGGNDRAVKEMRQWVV